MAAALPMNDTGGVTRIQRVGAGLFVLRYTASAGGLRAPLVSVESDAGVTLMSDNASGPHVLYAPGDALVVQAGQEANLHLNVLPRTLGGSVDAQLVLERLVCSAPATPVARLAPQPVQARREAEISVLAHVSRRGDVTAKPGEWICGPTSPLPIEGIELLWAHQPAGVEILTTATINLRGRKVLPPVRLGEFAGTRQKAAPIIGLAFSLSGPAATRYTLDVQALFLGGAVQSGSGAQVEFTGDTGVEPLLGLRLSLVEAARAEAALPAPIPEVFSAPSALVPAVDPQAAPRRAAVQAPLPNARVRVFRSARAVSTQTMSID